MIYTFLIKYFYSDSSYYYAEKNKQCKTKLKPEMPSQRVNFLKIFNFEERRVYQQAYPRRSKGPSRLNCMSYPHSWYSKCSKHLRLPDGGCMRHHHRLHTVHDAITMLDINPRARNMEMMVSINVKIFFITSAHEITHTHTHTYTKLSVLLPLKRSTKHLKDKTKSLTSREQHTLPDWIPGNPFMHSVVKGTGITTSSGCKVRDMRKVQHHNSKLIES